VYGGELPLEDEIKPEISYRSGDELRGLINSRKGFHVSWNNSKEPERENLSFSVLRL